MILICVEKFVECCDEQNHWKKFKKEEFISIKKLTGFGILCCGDGSVAGYKLEVTFNEGNSIIEKLKPDTYNRTKAARLIDYMLEYYTDKTYQTKSE